MLQKQRIILISGALLGIMAVFMIKVYIDQQQDIIRRNAKEEFDRRQASMTPVLVASKDIPQGVTVDADSFQVKNFPNDFVQPEAVTSLERISGYKTIAPIRKGEQITLSKLNVSYGGGGGGLSEATPMGKRAITISVDNVSGLAGMLKPGNYVDLITMIPVPVSSADGKQASQLVTVPLFQNVLVLAVGRTIEETVKSADRYSQEEKKESSPLITIALSPQEANIISYVQEQSKIRLVLRSPADAKVEAVKPATLDTVLNYIFPPQPAPPPVKERPKKIVDIYRGMNKESVIIGEK